MWADDHCLIMLHFENIKYTTRILFVVIMNKSKLSLWHFVLLSWRRIRIDDKIFVWHCLIEWNVNLIKTFLQWSCFATNIAEYVRREYFLLINRLFGCKTQVYNLSTYSSLSKHKQYPNTTFKQQCTYPEDLSLNLEVMLNQIRVKHEYFKKYTTSESQATRYSNAEVY